MPPNPTTDYLINAFDETADKVVIPDSNVIEASKKKE